MRVKIFESEQQFTLRLKSEENIFVLDWVWIWSCCALIIGGEWILCKNNKCNYFIIYLLVESDDNEFEQIFLPLENKKRILSPIKWQRKKKREYSIVFLYSQENFEVVSLSTRNRASILELWSKTNPRIQKTTANALVLISGRPIAKFAITIVKIKDNKYIFREVEIH